MIELAEKTEAKMQMQIQVQEQEKFIVAGFIDDEMLEVDYVVVTGSSLENAMTKAGSSKDFKAISGLRESEIRGMLKKIEDHKG